MLRLLGTPRWSPGGGRERSLADADALLLALLALQAPVQRARAAALLWPDSPPRQAGISLRQRIFRLKKTAGRDVVVGDAAIALADGVGHDLRLLEPGLRADPGHAEGELLAGVDADGALADWLDGARQRWRDARLQWLVNLAEEHAAAGAIAAALPYAQRAVAEAPAAEHGWRRLMRLHLQRGDRAAALAALARCRAWLRQALDAEPGAETLALARQIEAAAAAAAPPLPPPRPLLHPPRLLGRAPLLQAIGAAHQRGCTVLLVGEPGMGKSRLLTELAAGWGVEAVRPRPGEAPYAVAARLVAQWQPRCGPPAQEGAWRDWERLLPGGGEAPAAGTPLAPGRPDHFERGLLAWAGHAAAAGVAALVVDDLQFSDAASLQALLALAQTQVGPPALLAVRSAEQPPALQSWLASAAGESVQVLDLPGLTAGELADLLRSLPLPALDAQAWGAALWRQTGGNPFHTLQTLLACDLSAARPPPALPLPQHLQSLVQRRLARLGEPAQRLARLASVAGSDFSVALAAAVLAVHALDLAPAWRELQDAQFVDERGFAHDLLRESARATVPDAVARELHRLIGRAGAGLAPQRVAWHAAAGGDWALACSAASDAAQAAEAAGLAASQLAQLDLAAGAAEHLGDRQRRFGLLHRACLVALEVEPPAAVEGRLARLQATASGSGQQLDAALAHARWHGYRGEWPAMLTAARQAHAAAADDPQRRFEADCLLAAALAQSAQAQAALQCLLPWRQTAAAHPDPKLRHDWHANLGYVLAAVDRRREALEPTEQALAIALALDDVAQAMMHAANLCSLAALCGDLDRALLWGRQAQALRERLGDASSIGGVAASMNLGVILTRLGRFDEALARLEAAQAVFAADPAAARWGVVASNHLATLWLALGQTARAQAVLARQPATQWRALVLRARLPAAGTHTVAALQQALTAASALTERLGLLIELAAQRDPAPALAAAGQALALAQDGQLDGHALTAKLRMAAALTRLDRIPEALPLAQAASEALAGRCFAADLSPAESAWLLAGVWRAVGDAAREHQALAGGLRWLIDEALPQVPAPFRASFLDRHPVHRQLRAARPAQDLPR